jgi:hypothetical protein
MADYESRYGLLEIFKVFGNIREKIMVNNLKKNRCKGGNIKIFTLTLLRLSDNSRGIIEFRQ